VTEILILLFLTLAGSFMCSLLEAVLLSVSPAFIGILVKEKRKSGIILEHLKDNIQKPLSAILTLNTAANTLGSAAIAYHIQMVFGDKVITIASIGLTLAILIFSEIIPKSIGASHWKLIAPTAAYIIQALVILLYPFVFLFEKLGKVFKSKGEDEPEISREEVLMTAEISAEEGSIHKKEHSVIKNLLMLDKIYVSDIMTPRSVMFALEDTMTVEEVFNTFKPIRFSRIPVYNKSLDNILGLTYRYKIHDAVSHDQHQKLIKELTTPISSVSDRMTVQQVIDYFIKEKEHISLALDEYGVITGIVTLEDAIETLLGVEIVDELDSVEDMRKYALDQWQLHKQKSRRT